MSYNITSSNWNNIEKIDNYYFIINTSFFTTFATYTYGFVIWKVDKWMEQNNNIIKKYKIIDKKLDHINNVLNEIDKELNDLEILLNILQKDFLLSHYIT